MSAALDQWDAALHTLSSVPLDALSHRQLFEVLDRIQTNTARTPAVERRCLTRLAAEANPIKLGARTLAKGSRCGCGYRGKTPGVG